MLRKFLIASTLLAASGSVLAHGDAVYGRAVSVEPSVSVAFGTGYYDGFRVLVESGGSRYWTTTPYRPGYAMVLPPRHHAQHAHHHRHHEGGRDNRHNDWRDDHGGYREYRRHGRD